MSLPSGTPRLPAGSPVRGMERPPAAAFASARLYTFIDTGYLHGRSAVDVARGLCDGGSDVIQLRAKGRPQDDVFRLAESILPILGSYRVILVVNDHPGVAARLGPCACHLGQEDFFDAGFGNVRDVAPGGLSIGLSSHAPEQAMRAVAAGAAYVAVGPVFATATKPKAKPVTLQYVRWAAANLEIPWFAIGGVNLRTLDDVLAAGARRVCVVSAILEAENIAKACQDFRDRLASVPLSPALSSKTVHSISPA